MQAVIISDSKIARLGGAIHAGPSLSLSLLHSGVNKTATCRHAERKETSFRFNLYSPINSLIPRCSSRTWSFFLILSFFFCMRDPAVSSASSQGTPGKLNHSRSSSAPIRISSAPPGHVSACLSSSKSQAYLICFFLLHYKTGISFSCPPPPHHPSICWC